MSKGDSGNATYIRQVFEVQGVLAPVFTPFLESGNVDHSIIPIYMAHLNKHRVNGILGGTTGEGMSLSVEERKSLLEAWMSAAKPFGTKVIAQVGGAPLPDVLKLFDAAPFPSGTKCGVRRSNDIYDFVKKAAHAEKLKADGMMTLPELYYKPKTVDQLVCYLQRVCEAAPTLPLIYYHFPMMTGVDVNMLKFFSETSSKLPNLKGAKADLGVAEQVAHILREDQKIFIANHHIASSMLMGHGSSIATVANIFPDLVHNIGESVREGDVVKARVLQERLNKLVDTITAEGDFVPAMKTAMELVTGIRVGKTRPPLDALGWEQRKLLRDALISLEVQIQMAD